MKIRRGEIIFISVIGGGSGICLDLVRILMECNNSAIKCDTVKYYTYE